MATTVLLVEDNDDLRTVTRRTLTRAGYEVIEAAGGDEALDLVTRREAAVHVLLVDVVIPGMPGRELAAKVAALRPGIPVVYMSGYPREYLVTEGMLDPGVVLIEKPFAPEELLGTVGAVAGGSPPG